MSESLPALPERFAVLVVVVPMLTALVALLLHDFRRSQHVVGTVGLSLNLAAALWSLVTVCPDPGGVGRVLSTQMGNWPAPFGISVVIDTLSATLLSVTGFLTLCVYVYCLKQLPGRFAGGYFQPLYHFLLLGVNWAFVTGDLFNLFVSFEILLMASYAILVVGTTRAQMRSAYKYVLLNLLASTLFVVGCGFVYGQTGTLNFAELAALAEAGRLPDTFPPVAALLAVVFASKAAGFPLWFWLPDTYPTLPPALGGLFGGLLTKVGIYALLRVFVMVLGPDEAVRAVVGPALLVSAGGTMFVGVLGAVSSMQIRRILSVHVISQVGYMILGVGLATRLAVAAVVLYMVQHMIVKSALFLCGGLVMARDGTDDLRHLGGVARRAPWLGVLFFIAAMSLVGLPPLSGFYGKFLLIREGFRFEEFPWYGVPLAILAIVTGVLTLASMAKIWTYAFWGPEPESRRPMVPSMSLAPTRTGLLATGALVVAALAVGLGANVVLGVGQTAADGLLDSGAYVAAVLGEGVVQVADRGGARP